MKKIAIIAAILALTSCSCHRSTTSETKVATFDSGVSLFSAHDSIVLSKVDSIISSLDITIECIQIGDSVKQKKIQIHSTNKQTSTERKESKVDSTRFSHKINENKTTTQTKKQMSYNQFEEILTALLLALAIFFYLRHR